MVVSINVNIIYFHFNKVGLLVVVQEITFVIAKILALAVYSTGRRLNKKVRQLYRG